MAIVKFKTDEGFECEINEEVYDNWDLIDYIAMLDEDPRSNSVYLTKIAPILLGDEQYRKFKKFYKENYGNKFSVMASAIMKLIQSNEVKN